MKRMIFTASIFAALVTVIGVAAARTNPVPKERATVEFTQTVKLGAALLKGNYYIVHDDERMAKGEDCTYVYDAKGKLVVSFHCTPVDRPKSNTFRVLTTQRNLAYGPPEVVEIQFAGSTEAHQVPSF